MIHNGSNRTVDENIFSIFPTDAHNYKIIGILKTIKIPTIDPTRFSSRRKHHQGAISSTIES